jgi:hypothetical protein
VRQPASRGARKTCGERQEDAPRPAKRPKLQQSKEKQQAKGKVPAAPAAEQAQAQAQVPAQVSKELLQYWDRVVAVLKGTHPLVQVSWAAAGGRPRGLLLPLRCGAFLCFSRVGARDPVACHPAARRRPLASIRYTPKPQSANPATAFSLETCWYKRCI